MLVYQKTKSEEVEKSFHNVEYEGNRKDELDVPERIDDEVIQVSLGLFMSANLYVGQELICRHLLSMHEIMECGWVSDKTKEEWEERCVETASLQPLPFCPKTQLYGTTEQLHAIASTTVRGI